MIFQHLCRLSLTGLNWILAAGWLWRGIVSLRNLPQVPDLLLQQTAHSSAGFSADHTRAAVTVIVPARDEAGAIATTLESLLATEGLRIEIIAIDDRSNDATGEIMDRIAAGATSRNGSGNARLRVVHIDQLPAGWMGKTHAMAVAARMTTTPWLLFTDADVVYQPDTLAKAIAFLESERGDHLVLVPTVILRTVGERMMISFLEVISVWVARPWRVPDPRARHDFIGIGAFNLVHRDVYEAIGGFASLRMEVLEDVRLGFKIKRAGYRQRVAVGRDLIQIRWADGAMGVVNNLAKNAFSAFRFRVLFLLIAILGLGLQAILPLAGLFLGWPMRLASLVSLTMIFTLYRYFQRPAGAGSLYAATFPIAALLFGYACLRSAVLTLAQGGVRWRGTFYPLDELRRHCGELW